MPGSGTEDYNPTEVADITPLNNAPVSSRGTATGAASDLVTTPLVLRGSISIQVLLSQPASIFIGGTGLTAANGYEIQPGGSYDADAGDLVIFRVITAAVDVDYQVLELA